ncbi:MAG: hypothetical protein ACTSQP_16275 [Promethearchaeota archaeon]
MPDSPLTSEEIIFYLDLTTDQIKKKTIIKGIKNFINEREKLKKESSYGLIIFQSESNPISVYNKTDPQSLIEIIDESWETREKKNSYFENGLFEILSYIFGEAQKVAKLYRVIVITDTPSIRSEDYNTALYDLIVKAKNFSTSIDIIRIGSEKFYPDEVKLRIISSETQGGVFFCNDGKHFLDVINSLIKNRQEFNIIKPGDEEGQILEKDRTFYERLAADLISLEPEDEQICIICKRELCPICETYSDELKKCFNCGAAYHNCCAAEYSISNNIGFKHIFRCIKCQTLLKLDEELVKEIYEESQMPDEEEALSTDEDELEEEYIEEIEEGSSYIYHSIDEVEGYSENEISNDININESSISEINETITTNYSELSEGQKTELAAVPPPPPPQIEEERPITNEKIFKKVKIGGFFGKEITIKANGTSVMQDDGFKEQVWKVAEDTSIDEVKESVKKSITELKPPPKTEKKSKIKFCKICGNSVVGLKVCPNCGAKID